MGGIDKKCTVFYHLANNVSSVSLNLCRKSVLTILISIMVTTNFIINQISVNSQTELLYMFERNNVKLVCKLFSHSVLQDYLFISQNTAVTSTTVISNTLPSWVEMTKVRWKWHLCLQGAIHILCGYICIFYLLKCTMLMYLFKYMFVEMPFHLFLRCRGSQL